MPSATSRWSARRRPAPADAGPGAAACGLEPRTAKLVNAELPCAGRLPGRAALLLVLLGGALQGSLTRTLGLAGRDGWLVRDRLEAAARALPAGGTLFSLQARAPRLDYYRPDVTELALHPLIFGARDAGIAPEDFGPRLLAVAHEGPLAFDLGCLRNFHLAQAGLLPYLESVARAFEAQPGCRRARAGDWELLAFDHGPAAAEHGR